MDALSNPSHRRLLLEATAGSLSIGGREPKPPRTVLLSSQARTLANQALNYLKAIVVSNDSLRNFYFFRFICFLFLQSMCFSCCTYWLALLYHMILRLKHYSVPAVVHSIDYFLAHAMGFTTELCTTWKKSVCTNIVVCHKLHFTAASSGIAAEHDTFTYYVYSKQILIVFVSSAAF